MLSLKFLNKIILKTGVFSITVFLYSSFSYAKRFCSAENINGIAQNFISSTTPSRAGLSLSGRRAYDDFRRAYNSRRFERDSQFISYIDPSSNRRLAGRVLEIKNNGDLVVEKPGGGQIIIKKENLESVRTSQTAKSSFAPQRQRTPSSRAGLSLSGRGAYDDFRRSYNSGRFERDSQFISYIDPSSNRRLAGRVLEIKNNGDLVVEKPGGGQIIIKKENLESVRTSQTAKSSFAPQRQRTPHSSRSSSFPIQLRSDTYNRGYRPSSNLSHSEESFKRAFHRHTVDRAGLRQNPDKGYYFGEGYWRQFADDDSMPYPQQGWKFHISAKPENMGEIADKLLPLLQREEIAHKVIHPEFFNKYVDRIGNSQDTQQGKFITIYPKNEQQASRYAQILKRVMTQNNFNKDDFINIPNEHEIAPGVFVRYGRLSGEDLLDPQGRRIPGTENDILTPDGRVIEDPRGGDVPDFAKGQMYDLFQ